MAKLILLLTIFITNMIHAQWQTGGIPICDTSANINFNILPEIAADDSGGAYVCWHDARGSEPFDLYAQHINRDGIISWQKNGIPIAVVEGSQQYPQIVSDERGSAFIAWEDSRDGIDLYPYVQRIDKDGNVLWNPNGIKASEQGGLFISLANDMRGGVIMGWSSVENAFVQRLDSLGNRLWGNIGVQVTNRQGTVNAGDVKVTHDGSGGVIVVWAEEDAAYIQHIDSLGNTLWTENGIVLDSTSNKFSGGTGISTDFSGGAILFWQSWTGISGDTAKSYVQRVGPKGDFLWSIPGILIGNTGHQPRIIDDGNGGAFIGRGNKIQHIDSQGNKLWNFDGVKSTYKNYVVYPNEGANGKNGVWSFWSDDFDMYSQYIDSNGNVRWDSGGVVISDFARLAYSPKSASDGKGHAIVVWNALFTGGTSTVYAAKVDTLGIVTYVEDDKNFFPNKIKLQQNYPNPFNPSTTIEFSLPVRSHVTLKIFNLLGEEIKSLINKELEEGKHLISWEAENLPSGIYFYRLKTSDFIVTKKMILLH